MEEQTIDKFHESTFEIDEEVKPEHEEDLSKVADPKEVETSEEEVPVETSKETEETIEQSVETEEETEDLEGVDNPKSYKHFQKIAEQRLIEKTKVEAELELLRRQMEKPKEEPPKLQKPIRPQKPSNYNEVDAMTDPESPSARYNRELTQYGVDLAEYAETKQSQIDDEFQKQRAIEVQNQILASKKKELLPTFLNVNPDPIEAQKDLEWAMSKESEDPKIIAEFAHWYRTKKTASPIKPKKTKVDAGPKPPGITEGEQEPEKSPDDVFNETTFTKQKFRDI